MIKSIIYSKQGEIEDNGKEEQYVQSGASFNKE